MYEDQMLQVFTFFISLFFVNFNSAHLFHPFELTPSCVKYHQLGLYSSEICDKKG